MAWDCPLESLLQTLLKCTFHVNNRAFCLSHIFTTLSVLPKCPSCSNSQILQILRSAQITAMWAEKSDDCGRTTSRDTFYVNSHYVPPPPSLCVPAQQKGQYWQGNGGVSMFWKLAVLCGACVLLPRAEGVRTVTFRRTQPGEKLNQERARLVRDLSGDQRPPRGPPFIPCRIPLTSMENRVLDENTHEVGCPVPNTDHGKGSLSCPVV